MTLAIRPLDVHSDADCARAHEIFEAAMAFERPHASTSSLAERIAEWRYEDPAERMEMAVAVQGEEIVGVGQAYFPLIDNTFMAWAVIGVEPHRRRQGIGGALITHVVERTRREGRSTVLVEAAYPPERHEDHPYRGFLEKHGFAVSNVEVMRRLELPVAQDLLSEFEAQARRAAAGQYSIETYVGGVPEHRQPSLCAAMNRLGVDAPTGDVDFEEESLTPERYQDYLRLLTQQGRRRLTAIAVHVPSQQVVAYTDLILPVGSPTHAWQWGTLVHGDHRGHRLGMAVKVANLRLLQERFPERREVFTGNAAANPWMVSINEQLGFRVLELCPAFSRKLV